MDSPLDFVSLKTQLEAKGFQQLGIPYRDVFLRHAPRPHWWSYLLWSSQVTEIVIVGHLVWFYEKASIGWRIRTLFKGYGHSQKVLEDLLATLPNAEELNDR